MVDVQEVLDTRHKGGMGVLQTVLVPLAMEGAGVYIFAVDRDWEMVAQLEHALKGLSYHLLLHPEGGGQRVSTPRMCAWPVVLVVVLVVTGARLVVELAMLSIFTMEIHYILVVVVEGGRCSPLIVCQVDWVGLVVVGRRLVVLMLVDMVLAMGLQEQGMVEKQGQTLVVAVEAVVKTIMVVKVALALSLLESARHHPAPLAQQVSPYCSQ